MTTTSDHAVSGSADAQPPERASALPRELEPAAAALASGDHATALAQLRSMAGTLAQSPDLWRLLSEAVRAQGGDALPELIHWCQLDPGNPGMPLPPGMPIAATRNAARIPDSDPVARLQRTSVEPAESRPQVGRGAAEHGIHLDSSGD